MSNRLGGLGSAAGTPASLAPLGPIRLLDRGSNEPWIEG